MNRNNYLSFLKPAYNNMHKSTSFSLLLLLLTLFLIQKNFAQNNNSLSSQPGIPLITNYSIDNYSAGMQNWCVLQDKKGFIYVANESGVLEYNGVSWRLISIPNNVARSITMDKDGRIYVGGISQFGYLKPDSTGLLKYFSLINLIPEDKRQMGDVWTILVNSRGLFVQTFKNIFLLQADTNIKGSFFKQIITNPKCKIWNTKTRINPIFSVNNKIYVDERYVGLQELIGDSLKLLPGGDKFAQDLICIMLPYTPSSNYQTMKTGILIGSLRKGMYLFKDNKFEKFKNQADEYLIKNRLYFKGAVLNDGSFALGTQLGGIVIIDKQGRLKKIINKKTGLNDETIWFLYPDREGNLWAALNNGISKILYPSPLSEFDEKFGYSGTINSVKEINNNIFLTTSSGVYLLNNKQDETGNLNFIPINGIAVQSWDVYQIQSKVIAATNDGLFEINGTNSKLIDKDIRYTLCLHQLKKDPSIIFVGIQTGIAVITFNGKNFKFVGKVPGISNPISNITEDSDGNLLLEDVIGNLIFLEIPLQKTDLKQFTSNSFNFSSGPQKLFKFNNKIYFYDKKTIYNFNRKSNELSPAKEFNDIFKNKNISYLNIFSNSAGVLWFLIDNDDKIQAVELQFGINHSITLKNHPYLQIVLDNYSSNFIPVKIFAQKDNKKLWLGVAEKLMCYEPEFVSRNKFKFVLEPQINKVHIESGKTIYSKFQKLNLTKVNYSDNSIGFEFSLPSYIKESGNDYRYKLEGFDKSWSNWGKGTKKEYTNLSAGNYTFLVRSRNAVGLISSDAGFSFEILSAWYRTWWANLIGFIIILYLIYSLVRFRVRILEKRNVILERTVSERTAQINDQKLILEEQAKKLMELDKIKSNFFANISHEFRTPLTLIKGHIESILDNISDDSIKKKLDIVHSYSNRLHKLINQILDLSKLESGKLDLQLYYTDIVALVKNRSASFESLAQQKGIVLKTINKIESQILFIDKEKIEEALDNLIANAFKFTMPGGTITVVIDKIIHENNTQVLITVEDTGIGISEEKLNKIFNRFFQADDTSTKQYEGTGLGLTIVKEFIELHSGKIRVESKANVGSKFIITIPVSEDKRVELPAGIDNSDEINESQKIVLIVEDNIDVRNYIKENLEKDYGILEAQDGEDGIKKAVSNIPDLIITDVMMPKVDGFELCKELKANEKTSHVPIILLTAKADEKSKLNGLKIGADEFLSKPFSPKELKVRVENLIKIRQMLREKYKEISVFNPEEIKAASIDKIFLEKIFKIIKDNIENTQFSVTKLSEEASMSVSQLNRKLNALINQSAGKLIRSTRLDYAANLLKNKAGNISEIAYRVGFSDTPSFTHSFKEKFGSSPTEYLKSHK